MSLPYAETRGSRHPSRVYLLAVEEQSPPSSALMTWKGHESR
jgi:hypothetical protein